MSLPGNISLSAVRSGIAEIRELRFLTKDTYVVRFERNGFAFTPGQHIIVGLPGSSQFREYSVYSGEQDDFLEILVRKVIDGNLSLRLKECRPGQFITVRNSEGNLVLRPSEIEHEKHFFIATGTGIAPFHSYVKSFPDLDYFLLHGVRYGTERYDRTFYDPERYVACTSGDRQGDFYGRVTDYLRENEPDPGWLFHVVGNGKMIYEVYDILRQKGIERGRIRSEVYF